jgi:hypothetical protein
MPRAGFEPTIPVTKRPRPTSLDRAATGTGIIVIYYVEIQAREHLTPDAEARL